MILWNHSPFTIPLPLSLYFHYTKALLENRFHSSPFGLEGKRTYKNLCVKCCIRRHTFDSPKSWKICSRQRAKIMQNCINVQSSWNNKDRHLTTKRKKKANKKKRKNARNVCIYCTVDWITWRNSKKSTTHWLKHTDAESQKWSEKTLYKKYMKNVASNYYMMKNTSKIKSTPID